MSPFIGKIVSVLLIGSISCGLLVVLYDLSFIEEEELEQTNSGFIRQHGDYWVWNNYVTATEDLMGNESVTLTSHGTFMDLGLLPNVLKRWQAPISLTIFACGDDYKKFINTWKYLSDCLGMGDLMSRYVTIHLVFHQNFVSEYLDNFKSILFYISSDFCEKPAPFAISNQGLTFWYQQGLKYPVNLLRNIARLNVRTYYILALDLKLLPPHKFARKFLKFIWNHDSWRYADINEPYTTVFCLPTFTIREKASLPLTKFELLTIIREFNITSELKDCNPIQINLLHALNPKDELYIFRRSKEKQMCVGYISINELEPLYDENSEMESIYEEDTNLKSQVLIDLNYTFMILDGAFLLRPSYNSWQNLNFIPPSNQAYMKWRMWVNWHKFYSQLMNLVPDDFANSWYLRSRSTQYMINMENNKKD